MIVDNTLLCPCHKKPIVASLGDGVLIGSCPVTHENLARINKNGKPEWLDGQSPLTDNLLRPIIQTN